MGLLSKIKQIFENINTNTPTRANNNIRSVDETNVRIFTDKTNENIILRYKKYQDASTISLEEKHLYESEEYYNQILPFEGERAKPLIWYIKKYGTLNDELIVPDIIMLRMCKKYPNPKRYPSYWWFKYGIRNVGLRYKFLEKKGYLELKSGRYQLTDKGRNTYNKYEYVYYGHRDSLDSAWAATPRKYENDIKIDNSSRKEKLALIQENRTRAVKSRDPFIVYAAYLEEAEFLRKDKQYSKAKIVYEKAGRWWIRSIEKDERETARLLGEKYVSNAHNYPLPKAISEGIEKCDKHLAKIEEG